MAQVNVLQEAINRLTPGGVEINTGIIQVNSSFVSLMSLNVSNGKLLKNMFIYIKHIKVLTPQRKMPTKDCGFVGHVEYMTMKTTTTRWINI